jgi:hypothetical protein
MNTQSILNTIEVQHENLDLELNDKMIISDNEASQYGYESISLRRERLQSEYELANKKEYITKARKQRRKERELNEYNNNYKIQHEKAIQLIRNRFSN